MSEFSSYLTRLTLNFQGTKEEKDCAAILFNDIDISMGDSRLNNIAALTYNMGVCEKIFGVLDKALNAQDNPWKTLYKAVLMLHTIVLYGSEISVDMAVKMCPLVYRLTTYNSVLSKQGFFSSGTDYGGGVREISKVLYEILSSDHKIRAARSAAKDPNTLVPLGVAPKEQPSRKSNNLKGSSGQSAFGQGSIYTSSSSMGAGFGMDQIPGMYEGRPERYFDKDDDIRRGPTVTGSNEVTQGSNVKVVTDLLDMVFDEPVAAAGSATEFDIVPSQGIAASPQPDELALEKQRQLEQLLAQQQAQLKELKKQQQSNNINMDMGMGMQPQSNNMNMGMGMGMHPQSNNMNMGMGMGMHPQSNNMNMGMGMGMGMHPQSNNMNMGMGMGMHPQSNNMNMGMGMGMHPQSNNTNMGRGSGNGSAVPDCPPPPIPSVNPP